MKIQIISGSARAHSVTKRVAIHLYNKLTAGTAFDIGLIDMHAAHMPPVESVWNRPESAPAQMGDLARRVFDADAFILVSPEYNGSFSPALKNFLDHFPKQERKVFGIVTASPGSLGGIRAAVQLQNLIFGLLGIGSPRMLIVPEIEKKFDGEGQLIDPAFAAAVEGFIKEFVWLSTAVHHAEVAAPVG